MLLTQDTEDASGSQVAPDSMPLQSTAQQVLFVLGTGTQCGTGLGQTNGTESRTQKQPCADVNT